MFGKKVPVRNPAIELEAGIDKLAAVAEHEHVKLAHIVDILERHADSFAPGWRCKSRSVGHSIPEISRYQPAWLAVRRRRSTWFRRLLRFLRGTNGSPGRWRCG